MKSKILSIAGGSFLFLGLLEEGVCSDLIDKDSKYSSKNQVKDAEEKPDLLEELFLGQWDLNKSESYFEELKNESEDYNQSISQAALFLADKLQEQKNIEKAALAYAYAYYYDPSNESLDFPKKVKEKALKLKQEKSKKEFTDIMSSITYKLRK